MNRSPIRIIRCTLSTALTATLVFVGLPIVTAAAPTNLWTGTSGTNWFDNANWSQGTYPAPGEHVVVPAGTANAPTLTNATGALQSFGLASGQTLTVMGWESALEAVTLGITGTLTHAANNVASTNAFGEWVPRHRILLEGSNITVASTGMLDADWMGYRRDQGPGTPGNSNGGGGHAGVGGYGSANPGGPGYGDPAAPWQPGSGSGNSTVSAEGGGAIRIIAAGALTVHGTLRANGRLRYGTHGGGGSGGSIWVNCRTLNGSSTGLFQVNGGDGNYNGGGGSGGRIALHYDPMAQAGLPEPRPAIRFQGAPGYQDSRSGETVPARMGTLYLPDTLLVEGDFTAKRLYWVQPIVVGMTPWELDALVLDDCVLGLTEGVDLVVTNNLVLTNSAALHVFAAPASNVLQEAGATLTVGGRLDLAEGSWIFPCANPTNGAPVKFEIGGDAFIAENAGINAEMRGYDRGYGPGTVSAGGGGGGHGGHGGMAFGGACFGTGYGSAESPLQPGSAGLSVTHAGRGGGAIRLDVAGRLDLQGTLNAKGGGGGATHGGAGSGGSILVSCATLTGGAEGLVTVDGGLGNYYGGSGGGGRIALHYDPAAQAALETPIPLVRFSAYAFPRTSRNSVYTVNAREGTLWLPDKLFLTPVLDSRFHHVELFVDGWTSWAPDSLTLDQCVLTLPGGFVLVVTNDLVLDNGAELSFYAAPTNDPGLQRYGAELRVGRDLRIGTNSWIRPHAHNSNAAIVGMRVERHATIEPGGGMDAAGLGYISVPGNTQGPGAGQSTYSAGGYGGHGGGTAGGGTYGSAAIPLEPGSPGGWRAYGPCPVEGTGGGAIHLLAGGTLRIEGLLTADGWHGSYHGGSGGSGGSIFLAAGRVTGSGEIRAKGGLSQGDRASGGGGRIAVWHHLSLEEVENRLQSRDVAGLDASYPYPPFSGTVEVDWYGTSTQGEPGEGSRGFYTRVGTLFIIR